MEVCADTSTWNSAAQIATAVGVAATALSSIVNGVLNRWKIDKVDKKVDTAVAVAAATRTEAVGAVQEVKKVVLDVREVAVAVNAEVVAKVHAEGVEAGKEIANGKNGRH